MLRPRNRSLFVVAAWILAALALLAAPAEVTAFERVAGIELNDGEDFPDSAVIDPTGAFAYFGTDSNPSQVVKIGLTAPELSFDPASLDFGDVEVGTTSAPQTATLENTGNAVDSEPLMDLSDGNAVFERGEQVEVAPA